MTADDPLTVLREQAAHFLARAHADDRPNPTLIAQVADALAADQPLPLDHWIAEQVWPHRGHRRTWAELGPLARRRWAFDAIPHRRALLAAVPQLAGLARPREDSR